MSVPLQPTLWRTCRVIANRTRLQMLALLFEQPGQTVSAVATRLKQPLSITSEYLRSLEARGLLMVRHVGSRVVYRPSPAATDAPGPALSAALGLAFKRETSPGETVFKLATAFTHPRRIEIFRALQGAPRRVEELQETTHIPYWPLLRHLHKLEKRGFVVCQEEAYSTVKRNDPFGRELARWAAK